MWRWAAHATRKAILLSSAQLRAEVIKRDLEKKAVKDDITEAVSGMSPAERAQKLLDLGFDVDPDQLS